MNIYKRLKHIERCLFFSISGFFALVEFWRLSDLLGAEGFFSKCFLALNLASEVHGETAGVT